jgi:CBS domain-containing protein
VCFTRSAMGAQTVVAHLEVQGIATAADIREALAAGNYRSVEHY